MHDASLVKPYFLLSPSLKRLIVVVLLLVSASPECQHYVAEQAQLAHCVF